MMKLKTKQAYNYHNATDNKKYYMKIFIFKRPGKALRILHRRSFHKVMQVVLNYSSTGNKKIKADIVKRQV